MQPEPPPLIAPPPAAQRQGPAPKKGVLGVLAVIGIALFKWGKAALIFLKAFKFLAVLKTGGSMIVTAFVYSFAFGWPFAAGFVLTILVHEMGHVAAAALFGVPVTAPVFIPFMGAFILEKEAPKTDWASAVIGIGGPVAGTLAGLVCLAVFFASKSPLFLALANFTFFLNLFNLTPMYPLDGGWVTGAISPWFWVGGIVVLLGLMLTGVIRNPLLLIVLIMGAPRAWAAFRRGRLGDTGSLPATPPQKAVLGIGYLGLVGFLAFMMGETHLLIGR